MGVAVSWEHQRLSRVGFTRLLRLAWECAQNSTAAMSDWAARLAANQQKQQALREQERDLLSKIYLCAPDETQLESLGKRTWRYTIKRIVSFITLRDYRLLAQLNTLHVTRLNLLTDRQKLLEEQIDRRLRLLENLTDYEYR